MVSGKCLIWMGECRITLFIIHHLVFSTPREMTKSRPKMNQFLAIEMVIEIQWDELKATNIGISPPNISKYILDCTKYYISKYILDFIGYWIVKYLTFHFWVYNPLSRPSKPSEPNGFHRVTGFAASALEHQASQVHLPPLVASIIKDVWRVKTMV